MSSIGATRLGTPLPGAVGGGEVGPSRRPAVTPTTTGAGAAAGDSRPAPPRAAARCSSPVEAEKNARLDPPPHAHRAVVATKATAALNIAFRPRVRQSLLEVSIMQLDFRFAMPWRPRRGCGAFLQTPNSGPRDFVVEAATANPWERFSPRVRGGRRRDM